MAFTADGRFPRARLEPRANIVFCAEPREKQDVGHEGVATGRRDFSLPSFNALTAHCGVSRLMLFPRRTGRSSVERWSQDVTELSRPGVAALRYSHSS